MHKFTSQDEESFVFLYADLTDEHGLISKDKNGTYCLNGLFDFGDCQLGPYVYDFAAPAYFYDGDGQLKMLLKGYGLIQKESREKIISELFFFMLLHEFSKPGFLYEKAKKVNAKIDSWEMVKAVLLSDLLAD